MIVGEEDGSKDIWQNTKQKIVLSKEEEILLSSRGHIVSLFDDLEEGKFKDLMRKYAIGAVVKLTTEDKNVGVLILGQKLTGDIYQETDTQVLEILSPELAVAIQNAQRYGQIKRFSQTLEREVAKATRELKNANEKLKEIDKDKDEFISMAAHELRAPLTAIKGYLSMIIEGDVGEIPSMIMER